MGEKIKVIEQAESWLGAKEPDARYQEIIDTYNSNKKYKYDGQGCYEFCVACFIKALGLKRAKKLLPMVNYAEAAAASWPDGLSRQPIAGSIIFFDSDGNGKADHAELITGTDGDVIRTIDGNSGHAVKEKKRDRKDKTIMGYGNPKYEFTSDDLTDDFIDACINTLTIKRYSTGRIVLFLQEYLQSKGFYLDGYLDGVFGSVMETAVRQWQRNNGLYVDGIIGRYALTYILKNG